MRLEGLETVALAAARARTPLEWAMVQGNLGVALKVLGERESGTARLGEAVVPATGGGVGGRA